MLCHVGDWICGRLWWCCWCWRADFDSYGQRSWLVIEGDARCCVAILREKVLRIKVLATQRNRRARYGISVSWNILVASFLRRTKPVCLPYSLVVMAVMGLGAMYMMHLLAQDWNRIRPIQGLTNLAGQVGNTLNLQRIPALAGQASSAVTSAFQRGKRDTLTKELGWVHGRQDTGGGGGTKEHRPSSSIDWKGILARDPFECLQSLICQLMSGAEAHAPEAELLMNFLESSLELAPAKIGRAFSRGLALRGNTESCYNEYPFCLYSAKVMLRILRWFSTTNTSPENV